MTDFKPHFCRPCSSFVFTHEKSLASHRVLSEKFHNEAVHAADVHKSSSKQSRSGHLKSLIQFRRSSSAN